MFQQGDYIMYGTTGICQVKDIAAMPGATGPNAKRLYYRLAPVYGTEVIYVPVDGKVFMRPILTPEEARELVAQIPLIQEDQDVPQSQRELDCHYRSAIESHRCEDLVQVIKTIYQKSRVRTEHGKRPGRTEETYRKRAEDLLHGELAVALGIPREEVPEYIRRTIQGR